MDSAPGVPGSSRGAPWRGPSRGRHASAGHQLPSPRGARAAASRGKGQARQGSKRESFSLLTDTGDSGGMLMALDRYQFMSGSGERLTFRAVKSRTVHVSTCMWLLFIVWIMPLPHVDAGANVVSLRSSLTGPDG